MEKIERYLDQACHGIAGPRALRAHIRQELKEHLLDAIAQHKDAGMSDDDALTRALEDFGGPDLVRSELEATHGHRLMTVVLDKALQWKEKTMKAKWLWTSWAHIAVGLTVLFEIIFIVGIMVFLVPKYREVVIAGTLADDPDSHGIVAWSMNFQNVLSSILDWWLYILIAAAIVTFLFEWRVRTENKSLIRFSILGTIAAALVVLATFTAASVSLPYLIVLTPNSLSQGSVQLVTDRLDTLDRSLSELDQAVASGDHTAIRAHIDSFLQVASTLRKLMVTRAAVTFIHDRPTRIQVSTYLRYIETAMVELRDGPSDPARLKSCLQKYHAAFDPLHRLTTPEPPPSTDPH